MVKLNGRKIIPRMSQSSSPLCSGSQRFSSLFGILLLSIPLTACNSPFGKAVMGSEFLAGVTLSNSASKVTVANQAVASGSAVSITVMLKDTNGVAYISKLPTVVLSNIGGTSTGTFGKVVNNGDGSYTTSFTGITSGTATTVQVKVNDQLMTSTAPTLTVIPGPFSLSKSTVTVSSASVVSGSSATVTLTAIDAAGNQLTSGGLTVAFSDSAGSNAGSLSAVTDHGDGTYTASFTGNAQGAAGTLSATINGSAITSTLPTLTVNTGTASQLVWNTLSNTASLTAFSTQPIITIKDTYGNTVTTGADATALITLSLGSGTGTLSGSGGTPLVKAAVAGVADFSGHGLNIDVAGAKALTASKASTTGSGGVGVLTQNSGSFSITNGPAIQVVIHTQPGGGTAGSSWSGGNQPVFYIEDTSGNLITSAPDATAAVSVTPSSSSLGGTTTVNASGGIATFTNLSMTLAGSYTLTATKASTLGSSGTAAETSSASSTYSILAAAANKLAFTQFASTNATAGTAFGIQPRVQIQDQYGNNIQNTDGDKNNTVVLTASTSSACAGDSSTGMVSASVAASNGLASFGSTAYTVAPSTIYLKASDSTDTSITAACSGTSSQSTVVSAASPAAITASATGSTGQSGVDSATLSTPFTATVTDTYGNVVSSTQVDWAVTAGGGSFSSSSTVTTTNNNTDSSGNSQVTLTLGSTPTTTAGDTVTAKVHSNTALVANFTATTNAASFGTYNWPFSFGTDGSYNCYEGATNYSTLSSCNMDLTGGVIELTASQQSDINSNSIGFGGATMSGGAQWDATNSYVRLSTTSPNLELDSSWTPAWNNVVGYWKLNEASGASSVADSGPVGTYSGTPTSVTFGATGKLGNAGNFNGSSSQILIQNSTSLNLYPITISAWVNYTNNGSEQRAILNKYTGSSANGYNLFVGGGAICSWYFVSGSRNVYPTGNGLCTSTAYNDGNWHFITYVVNSSGGQIFVDGRLSASASWNGAPGAATSANSIVLGNYAQGAGSGLFSGYIDEVAVWNTALSASAINTIYQHQSAKYTGTVTSRVMDGLSTGQSWTTLGWTPTLPFFKALPDAGSSESSSNYSSQSNSLMNSIIGLWHMDEATGSTAYDQSGAGGSAAGNITWTSTTVGQVGKLGSSVSLNGSSHGSSANSVSLSFTTGYSASAWFKTSTAADAKIVYAGPNSSNGASLIQVFTGGTLRFCAYTMGCYVGTTSVVDNRWHHAVTIVTGSGSNATIKTYLDGKTSSPEITGSATGVSNFSAGSINIGYDTVSLYFTGNVDEVAVWNRALSTAEVLELYRRGANRLLYQVRACADSVCASPSPSSPGWVGPDGTTQSYFSELYNTTNNYLPAVGASPAPAPSAVATGLPTMTFSNFGSVSIPTSRYFQYRAIMETDDANTLCNYGGGANTAPCSPELQSVTVGPTHYDKSSPAIYSLNGQTYYTLSSFTEALGSSCAGGATYNISPNGSSWYWWNTSATANCAATTGGSGAWCAADGTTSKSNAASVITSNVSTFPSQTNTGTGTIYVKAYLNSNGTQACQIDNLAVQGTK